MLQPARPRQLRAHGDIQAWEGEGDGCHQLRIRIRIRRTWDGRGSSCLLWGGRIQMYQFVTQALEKLHPLPSSGSQTPKRGCERPQT